MPVLVICITKRRRGKDWIEQQSRISSYICPADNSKHVEHDCFFFFDAANLQIPPSPFITEMPFSFSREKTCMLPHISQLEQTLLWGLWV